MNKIKGRQVSKHEFMPERDSSFNIVCNEIHPEIKPITICDNNGNVIHEEDMYGIIEDSIYDDNNNRIYMHRRQLQSVEGITMMVDLVKIKYEYNEDNNMLYYNNMLIGIELWYEYDNSGKLIRNYDSLGNEAKYSNNKITYTKNGSVIKKYDDNQNMIYYENSESNFHQYWTYNQNSKMLYYRDDNDYEIFVDYDSEGHKVFERNTKNATDRSWGYDENDVARYYKVVKIHEVFYDDTGRTEKIKNSFVDCKYEDGKYEIKKLEYGPNK